MCNFSCVRLKLTNKELPFPLVRFVIYSYFESSVTIVPESRLHANSSVSVHHSTNNGFRVEPTGDSVIGIEAGAGDIDDGSSQHVTTFRSEH